MNEKCLRSFVLHHKKNIFLHIYAKTGADQLHGNHPTDQCLCFCCIDSRIPLLLKSEISNILPCSVAEQPSLCRTYLVRNPEDRFTQYTAHLSLEVIQHIFGFPTRLKQTSQLHNRQKKR